MKKEIDLIIPAYKAHKTIFKTLCSIAEQSCSDKIKVTIVNDCCPQGNYKKIINIFKNNLDIQEIKMPKNGGPGAARQFGVDHTELPYVMFMDADDCLMGPYAITQLLNFLEEQKEDVTFSGFVEEFLPNQYVMHLQDHIWFFGKIYKRDFLKKHNLIISNQRANEDTCFNKKILLLYENAEKDLPYLEAYTYAWNYKEGSITRVNDGQYTYDQSICGYIDGIIEVYNWAKKQNIKESVIRTSLYKEICFLYISYCDVGCNSEVFQEQNLEYIKKFFNLVWKEYDMDYHTQEFIDTYEFCIASSITDGQSSPKLFMAQPNIVQFMDMLNELPYNENDIYEIWKRIPQKLKQNNIDCGVCEKDYYLK